MMGSPEDRYPDMGNGKPAPLRPSDIRPVSDDDLKYALDGDGHGAGGHRSGTGAPGQSEFPRSWDEVKLREAIEAVLYGGSASIALSKDGVIFRDLHDDVVLAVPVHDYGRYWEVATAYPLSGVGVVRNGPDGTPRPVPLSVGDLTSSLE
jgi:hypothetical protein